MSNFVFEMDPDSDGFSVEIFLNEGGPMMECVAHLDLFSRTLRVERVSGGTTTYDLPPLIRDRLAAETWAAATIRKVRDA
jgi:hypothetical protein